MDTPALSQPGVDPIVRRDFGDQDLNAERDRLVAAIRACFPVEPVPSYVDDCGSVADDPDEYLDLKNKRWTDVPAVAFTRWYDIHPMIGLPAELWRYYLPAFMTHWLTDVESSIGDPTFWRWEYGASAAGDAAGIADASRLAAKNAAIDRFFVFV